MDGFSVPSTLAHLCYAAHWPTSHPSLLVTGLPAVSMELRQPCSGEGDGGAQPCGGASLCKTLPLDCLTFLSICNDHLSSSLNYRSFAHVSVPHLLLFIAFFYNFTSYKFPGTALKYSSCGTDLWTVLKQLWNSSREALEQL